MQQSETVALIYKHLGKQDPVQMQRLVRLVDAAVAAERERCSKLQQVWEDTRTQRDELLAHLTRKEPLPAWAVEWIKVYGA
jgi:hypothetical protein